jgi:hypothetical protein
MRAAFYTQQGGPREVLQTGEWRARLDSNQ